MARSRPPANDIALALNNSVRNEFTAKLPQGGDWLIKRVSSNGKVRVAMLV